MTVQIIGFWAITGSLMFAFTLAVQMRVMVARVLGIALGAHNAALDESETKQVVVAAANIPRPQDAPPEPDVDHLRTAHPGAIGHLRLARKATHVLPPVVFLLLVVGWKILGVF